MERDLKLIVSLLKSLSQRVSNRSFSDSERSAFKILLKYLMRNFLKSDFVYKAVSKHWSFCTMALCNLVKAPVHLDG